MALSCGSEGESEASLDFAHQGSAEDSDSESVPPFMISDSKGESEDLLDFACQGNAEDSESDSGPPSMISDALDASRTSSFVDVTNTLYKVLSPLA